MGLSINQLAAPSLLGPYLCASDSVVRKRRERGKKRERERETHEGGMVRLNRVEPERDEVVERLLLLTRQLGRHRRVEEEDEGRRPFER